MNKQEKIDLIYKEIANKELSAGCEVKLKTREGKHVVLDEVEKTMIGGPSFVMVRETETTKMLGIMEITSTRRVHLDIKDIDIIGHPVMIGDVLDWYSKKHKKDFFEKVPDFYIYLCGIWLHKRKPIERLGCDVINYIYKLLKDE